MQEIEVGEYVRTSNGGIYKYDENNEKIFIDNFKEMLGIVKHSKNIIDLIGVGDYVNGYKVLAVGAHTPSGDWIDIDCNKQSEECTLWKEEIKTLVTKQQFESIEYKI